MLTEKPLDYATATTGALAKALAARQVSAVELFDEAVRAIEAKDGPINAVPCLDGRHGPDRPPPPPVGRTVCRL